LKATVEKIPILTSLDAFRHFLPQFQWEQEEVHIVALNSSKFPISTKLLFRGTVDFCLFHPRDVFRFLIEFNASSFILAHNHPNGDPTPSYPDIVVTQRLFQAARLMQVELIDHIILTPNKYISLNELGIFIKKRKSVANRN
jgi:DNA repair protein RadC